MPEDNVKRAGLCFRCEHRARFFETGSRPRCECGDVYRAKHGCYMYRPVAPVALTCDPDDDRPALGPAMIASRVYYAGIAEGKYRLQVKGTKLVPYFEPDGIDDGPIPS